LNHIPFIIAALFLSQLVHELGHAIAGALYGIPILSSGASIIVCIPAAFVSYPTVALDTLRRSARSRITAAGPFHNLLFWCFCFLASYFGSGLFCALLGYKDISSLGRVVLKVEDVRVKYFFFDMLLTSF
jgi:S2P endopeptidase